MFERKKPRKTCPFRRDENAVRHLHPERAEEISDHLLLDDGHFYCHDDLELRQGDRQHCAGALIILEKLDSPNQMMRIAERVGPYDRNALTGHDEVFDDFEEWMECQG